MTHLPAICDGSPVSAVANVNPPKTAAGDGLQGKSEPAELEHNCGPVLVPIPSWPTKLPPQQYSAPLVVIPHVSV